MRDLLEGLIAKFNAKVDSDPSLRGEIGDLQRTILIELKDGTKWHFTLKDQHVAALLDGGIENPDVTLLTDSETLRALILREMGPFKAYATGKLRFKGSLDDLARFRKFF
jgi:putative sterol carrier protein